MIDDTRPRFRDPGGELEYCLLSHVRQLPGAEQSIDVLDRAVRWADQQRALRGGRFPIEWIVETGTGMGLMTRVWQRLFDCPVLTIDHRDRRLSHDSTAVRQASDWLARRADLLPPSPRMGLSPDAPIRWLVQSIQHGEHSATHPSGQEWSLGAWVRWFVRVIGGPGLAVVDGGNKEMELHQLSHLMTLDSIMLVHDWARDEASIDPSRWPWIESRGDRILAMPGMAERLVEEPCELNDVAWGCYAVTGGS